MKKWLKDHKYDIIIFVCYSIAIIFVMLLIALFAITIYVYIKYGNTNVSELPAWVWFLIYGRK